MRGFRTLRNSGFVLLLAMAVTVTNAQVQVDTFLIKRNEANVQLKNKDFETAIRLYTEAIELFPKTNEFTPRVRIPLPSEGNLAPPEYRGLETLYMGRFWAFLYKKDDAMAQADMNRSLMVLDLEKKRDYERARLTRSAVSLERERKNHESQRA